MNRFARFAASALALSLVPAMLMGCGKKEASTGSDLDYIKQKGTLVVGITDFAPMDYQDADGSWIGFDADLAKAFAESLGVEVQFQTIEWDNKVMELDGKTIDVVWNGMTLTDEVTSSMACSNAYCNNAQVVILPADKAADYDTVDSLSGLRFAVESGSAGMAQAEEKGLTYTDVVDQATALLEVKSGTADAAIIDSLMAGAMVGEGTNYANLAIGPVLNAETGEQYGVGFRKGSDAVAALNEFFRQQWESGALQALAAQVLVGRGADHIMEAPQALAGADGRAGSDLLHGQVLGVVGLHKLQHRFNAVGAAQRLFGHGARGGGAGNQQVHHLGKRSPRLELVPRYLVDHGTERPLHAAHGFPLPIHAAAQHGAGAAGVSQQRLQIFLPKHAVRAAAHQPGMEYHAVQPAAPDGQRPVGMQHPGIDEQAVPLGQRVLFPGCSGQHAALAGNQQFQLLMPVPGYRGSFQIVVVAGDGKRRGAVDGQFPPSGIGLGIAGGQGHGKSSFFGEIILPI